MENNIELNNILIDELYFSFYDDNIITSIHSMIDNLKNNSNIFNTNNTDENNLQFNIEFEILDFDNEIKENNNYFNNCKEINEKIGKSDKIKINNPIIEENCLICIDKFKINEYKRSLPKCNHYFHKKCIDKWLKKCASCPVCRDNLL